MRLKDSTSTSNIWYMTRSCYHTILALCLLLLCSGCFHRPQTASYREQYAYLKEPRPREESFEEPDYYLVFLVAAYHFDYTDYKSTVRTMCKHPSDGGKEGNVGHCWVFLRGLEEGQEVCLEGGHSGELGILQPKYFAGVMNYYESGYLNPTPEEKEHPRYEPNPIKYLWEVQWDGFFQEGSGGYKPTYAALVPLTAQQYERVKKAIDSYCFEKYSITENQCATFLERLGAEIDFPIEHEVPIPIDPKISFTALSLRLWEDPRYKEITLSVPDRVEQSLMEAVAEGRALPALNWYTQYLSSRPPVPFKKRAETVYRFPARFTRYLLLR